MLPNRPIRFLTHPSNQTNIDALSIDAIIQAVAEHHNHFVMALLNHPRR